MFTEWSEFSQESRVINEYIIGIRPYTIFKHICLFILAVLGLSCGTRDLHCGMRTLSCGMHAGSSCLTRDRTWAPWIGSVESSPLDHQGSPLTLFLKDLGTCGFRRGAGRSEASPACLRSHVCLAAEVGMQAGSSWGDMGSSCLCLYPSSGLEQCLISRIGSWEAECGAVIYSAVGVCHFIGLEWPSENSGCCCTSACQTICNSCLVSFKLEPYREALSFPA